MLLLAAILCCHHSRKPDGALNMECKVRWAALNSGLLKNLTHWTFKDRNCSILSQNSNISRPVGGKVNIETQQNSHAKAGITVFFLHGLF